MKEFLKSKFWQRYGAGVTACVIGVIGLITVCALHAYWENRLDSLEDEQVTAEAEQAVITSRENIAYEQAVAESEEEVRYEVTGMETSRKETDDAIMADIMSYVTTWSSSETYTESRDALLEAYPWLANTSFMTMYFPAAEDVILTDGSGDVVSNVLDDGRNITFVSMGSHIVGIEDGVYSYIAELVTQSVWSGTSSEGRLLVTYDMTEDGVAQNLNAYSIYS